MGHLRFTTLTGADEHTDFARMKALSGQFPDVEWGVLLSPSDIDMSTRHPSLEWLEHFAKQANQADLRIALHLCGSSVKKLMAAAASKTIDAEAQRLFDLAERFGRVQLNTRAKSSDVEPLRALIARLTRTENRTRVILQWNDHNEAACKALAFEHGFEVLIDSSGGRGIERASWPTLERGEAKRAGMAGGLGPDNLATQLPLISSAAGERSFWVDMEGKLRDARDRFDLDRCEQVLRIAQEFCRRQEHEQAARFGDSVRNVADLEGLWLDWWVGAALERNMVVPPPSACKAVILDRHTGDFNSYCPSEDLHLAMRVMSAERIAVLPAAAGSWSAYAVDDNSEEMPGEDLHIAGLRAVVAKHFGTQVACNPFNAGADAGYLE